MTLSNLSLAAGAASDQRSERKVRGVGVALGKCLRQALESGRLQCGILASANLLQRCPERVLLCLLPVPHNNVCDHTLHIHHTLISAFCAEHGIRCLRVQGEDLHRAVTRLTDWPADGDKDTDSGNVCHVASASSHCGTAKPDLSCVLVRSPEEELSFEDEVILDYHDDVMSTAIFPKPVLSIPG